jgi:chromosome segregation ATPase
MYNLASLQYLGSLVSGRRVLVVGMAPEPAEHARELGARKVCIATSRQHAEAFSHPEIEVLVTDLDRMELRSSAFDVAMVFDLPSMADPSAVLSEAMRVVGLKGHVVVALRNPACEAGLSKQRLTTTIDYYQLYEMLAGLFPSVQMVGQSPFVGYAVADLGFDGPELPVSFDGSLLGDSAEEIEWFLAVCGQVPAVLDPYLVVQVPLAELSLDNKDALENQAAMERLEQELKAARLELSTRGVKIESLQKDLEQELMASEAARARGVELAKQLDDERKAKQRAEIESEYSRRSQTMEKPQDPEWFPRVRQAEERAKVAENARDELVLRLRSDAAELERLRKAQEEHEAKSRKVAAQHEELSKRAVAAEKELAELKTKLSATANRDEPARAEQLAAMRQAQERARSAEASRDALLEQMRADAAELDRIRQRYDELRDKSKRAEQDKAAATQLAEEEKAKTTRLEAELEQARQQLAQSQQQLAQSQQQLAQSQQQLESNQASALRALPSEADTDELQTARLECAQLEERLAQVAAQKVAAQIELERQTFLVRDMSLELRRIGDAASSAHSSNQVEMDERTEQEMARLRGALSGQHRARVEAELEAATLQMEMDRLQMELLARDAELEGLRRMGKLALPVGPGLFERDQRIAELETELQSAKWRASELEARSAELARQISSAIPSDAALEKALVEERDAAIVQCKNLEKELVLVRTEKQHLAQTLASAERANHRLEQEVDSRRAREERLCEAHETCRARIESLEQEISASAKQRRDLENELARLQESLDAIDHGRLSEEEIAGAALREGQLTEHISRLEAELAAAIERQDEGEAARQLNAEKLRLELLTEFQEETRLAEQQSRQQMDELETVISDLKARLVQQDEWSHDAGADAARLSGELSELADQCAALEREMRERLASEAAMERTLLVLRQDALSAWRRSGSGDRGSERNELNQRLARLEFEKKALASAVAQTQEQISEAEDKVLAARRARAATSEKLADALSELEALGLRSTDPATVEAELAKQREEIQTLSIELAQATQRANEKEALVTSLCEQLEEREQRSARLEKEVAQLIEATKEHESDIAAWEMELKFRNARITQLETELNQLQNSEARG